MSTETLKVTTPSDREIVLTRVFNASRKLVFDAFTKPELVRRWLTGPPGWVMDVCEIDLKVGGAYRYVWRGPDEVIMGMGGIYRSITAPEEIVATEKFDQPWYPGEAVGTVDLVEKNGQTTLTQTLVYESREARDTVLKTPMEQGISMSYDKLAELLPTLA
ncbi:MAG TPA: SRPBCC family protein [Blastocatellia bacterium]|nr:SRPBCC family protein [Blastocatellia bacterium]